VLEGTGKMLLGDKTIDVKPGDLIFIPKKYSARVTRHIIFTDEGAFGAGT
jgi:mannose-6-phosphate isomerase-like protein (cupin superfamily)